MYARHLTFRSTPDNRPEIEAFAGEVYAFFQTLDGFVSVVFGVSEDETEYGSFSLWDTREAAENAGRRAGEEIATRHKRVMMTKAEVKYFEAFSPAQLNRRD
ncbi:antibiotic biosynthesis monooxygenase family protein [Marinobacterium sediminicola]|uniref:ABM domain-containing protein n=1 Tax=Marinobacterium sediminicola TaxID=518898 RepID=A0ABY1S0S6_9GAMM|nr:hypothetical protein [Marinobacterium sediminicola]ULG68320.1 hypothetical protein LN244_11475 [Marinobacterium sediminicola]SMR74809.1 hypothetical protein SAMN04487964_108106 [Marinobacterium sediminicola]